MGEENENKEEKAELNDVTVAMNGLKDLIELRDLAAAKLRDAIQGNAGNMEELFNIYVGLSGISVGRMKTLLHATQDAKKCSG